LLPKGNPIQSIKHAIFNSHVSAAVIHPNSEKKSSAIVRTPDYSHTRVEFGETLVVAGSEKKSRQTGNALVRSSMRKKIKGLKDNNKKILYIHFSETLTRNDAEVLKETDEKKIE